MKIHALASLRLRYWRLLRGSVRALRLLLGAGCLALFANASRAQENQLDIGVRSTVVDKAAIWAGKSKAPGAGEYGRIYGILSVQEIKSEKGLVKPVDEGALVSRLLHELDANGFHEFVKGQKPEILLAVSYGRGGLHNPYIRDTGEVPTGVADIPQMPTPSMPTQSSNSLGSSRGIGASDAPTVTITGAFANQLMDEKTPGYQMKLQKATFEKLYIMITAWEYPTDPNAKMLWRAVMVVDDPDHRDLNDVAAAMLEAGAPYFDKQNKEPEMDVYKPLPEGHVKVGAPEVVEPAKPKT